MKKSYILASVLLVGTSAIAQVTKSSSSLPKVGMKYEKTDFSNKTTVQSQPKAEGDILWSNGFSTASEWTVTSVAGTTGIWEIGAALPVSLSSQGPGAGFPTTLPTPPFAFIDSDGAGDGLTQNSSITFNGNINLTTQMMLPISVVFKNIYRHFLDQNYVAVSNDGVIWNEIRINQPPEVATNTNSANPEIESVLFGAPAGGWSSNVKIRFRYVGAYDWFWAIDDIEIQVPLTNNIALSRVDAYVDTTGLPNRSAFDYYTLSTDQVAAFPGHVFNGMITNLGAGNQSNARVSGSAGAYSGLSGPGFNLATLTPLASDTFKISTPYLPVTGVNSVNFNSTISPATDSELINNTKTLSGFTVGGREFGRDNGVITSSFQGFAGAGNIVDGFGNQMQIFADQEVEAALVYIPTQVATYLGGVVSWRIDRFDTGTGEWIQAEFIGDDVTLVNPPTQVGTWLKINAATPFTLNADDNIRLMIVRPDQSLPAPNKTFRIGLAQETTDGVVAVKTDGTYISLAEPRVAMIRLLAPSGAGLNTNDIIANVQMYPNPATSETKVSIAVNGANDIATITVTDLSGKVISTSTANGGNGLINHVISTDKMANGTYLVNITVNGSTSTQKLIVKK